MYLYKWQSNGATKCVLDFKAFFFHYLISELRSGENKIKILGSTHKLN